MDLTVLNRQITDALKKGDSVRTLTLRSLLSAVKYAAMAKYQADWEKRLSESDIGEVITKQVKTHKESIGMFSKAGRQELVDKEKAELAILEEFMPQQMNEQQLGILVDEALASGETNFGKLMGLVMKKAAGRADGAGVSKLLKAKLPS